MPLKSLFPDNATQTRPMTMSVEAIAWALNDAPVDSPTSKLVLIALANHARPDGSSAFPSVQRIMRYTCLSERAIRQHLDALERAGVIQRCDPAIVAAYIKRADKRPIGYDLCMGGVHDVHLGDQRGASHTERGASPAGDGVHLMQERGAPPAPKPYMNRTEEPYREEESDADASTLPATIELSNFRDDAERLCNLLADLMVENGCKRPTITSAWIVEMDRLMRLDGRAPEQVENAIRWCQAHEFWSANIHSPGKLRAKYDTMRLQASREVKQRQPRGFDGIRQFLADHEVI